MDHREAVQQMATERYLLDELSPELREAFEEHYFDCPDCALDLRAAGAFVDEARPQLPAVLASAAARPPVKDVRENAAERAPWLSWLSPWKTGSAFIPRWVAGPVFAALLAIVGYQNLVTYPALLAEAEDPRILPWISLHAGTRSAEHTAIQTNHRLGFVLLIDLPQQSGYASYDFQLHDPDNKLAWSHDVPASSDNNSDEENTSLLIPGATLRTGAYTLTVFGIGKAGDRTVVQQRTFDLQLTR